MSTIYASFNDPDAAEKAMGALLDHDATPADMSIIAGEGSEFYKKLQDRHAEKEAKKGITTTTGADAASGAFKGTAVGMGVGTVAALAAIFVPGIGLVLGGGVLAMAIAAGAATTVAGTAAGAVIGYLKDQGLPEEAIVHYENELVSGGAILAVAVPTGKLSAVEVEALLEKYGARNLATYNSPKTAFSDPALRPPQIPIVVDNPNIDPIAIAAPVEVVWPIEVHQIVDASTGETRVVAREDPPVMVDPLTGAAAPVAVGLAIDPITGQPVQVAAPIVGHSFVAGGEVIETEEEALARKRREANLY